EYHIFRSLNSFPTRRSSDLASQWRGASASGDRLPTRNARSPRRTMRAFSSTTRGCASAPLTVTAPILPSNRVSAAAGGAAATARSEEHTSELQSLAYLVCRL